jgi:NAD(P)-dependent dehydrogenase (short-subunit alcohol dehydrogenase family)
VYTTSKVALDHMARCWQVEHPDVDVTVLAVGPTTGTELLTEVPRDVRQEFVAEWLSNGGTSTGALDPDDVAEVVIELMTGGARVASMTVTPPPRRLAESPRILH